MLYGSVFIINSYNTVDDPLKGYLSSPELIVGAFVFEYGEISKLSVSVQLSTGFVL